MMIPVVVALWQDIGFQGRKRLLVEDTPNLAMQAFDDTVSAIGIHPGPDYAAWLATREEPPYVVFYEHPDYEGRGLALTGGVQTLALSAPFGSFNDIISSVRIGPPILRETVDLVFLDGITDSGEHIEARPDATIAPIPLIVEIYADPPFRGLRLTIVENSASIAVDFGQEFSGVASSIQVIKGPNYNGEAAQLFSGENFSGQSIILPPGSYDDLRVSHNFDNQTRSIMVRP